MLVTYTIGILTHLAPHKITFNRSLSPYSVFGARQSRQEHFLFLGFYRYSGYDV